MNANQIILELMALEVYFEEGRKRCYSLRKDLEQFSAPAPSGDGLPKSNMKLIEILNKRKTRFQKARQTKNQ